MTIEMALLARHPVEKGEWAVFREMATSTGGYGRKMDLFAVSCWPSSHWRTVAYEVKRTRGDFKREIEDPSKRGDAERVEGECYFATPPGLLKVDEVPEGWGLVECGAGGARVLKHASQRTIEPWPLAFCAAIARRSCDPKPPWPVGVWRAVGGLDGRRPVGGASSE